ncbi:phosphoglycerate kinase [Tautonia sociabilis]|uniref:Phosphoglycerate kinase n=1 Tax=Tautonia sociabilis TaxID=2080755 RepID=A0A432MPD7_9BACT|nr:phosphoglycerate kinase [Tautonia sociabilis]RUL89301.1 phosphoglycerate kinase [Tautonia sociabilis]
MAKQTIKDLDFHGKKALVRVDFNVPLTKDGDVSDDRRIRAALPTLNHILEQGGALILVSHLGRPSGDPTADAPFTMDKVAARLQELIGRPVQKADDTVGPDAQAKCSALKPGEIVVLENVRFNTGEKKGDPEFARALASLADCYVNDAFGTCHRNEASMVAVPEQFPPDRRAIGFLVEKELTILDQLLGKPKPPMVAVMGGAKVSDKIGVIENLLKKVDTLLIGGAMTYTFLKAQGHEIGKSRCEDDRLDVARRLLDLGGGKIKLPEDHLVTTSIDPKEAKTSVVEGSDLPEGQIGIDIGPKTAAAYAEIIKNAGTVVWNGPMGKFEDEPFRAGTLKVAEAMASSPAVTAVGGGETAEAVEQFGLADKVSHVSTGGGAFLEALEGKAFKSLDVIPDRS